MYIYLFAILPVFYSIIIYLLFIFLIIYWLATVGDHCRRPLSATSSATWPPARKLVDTFMRQNTCIFTHARLYLDTITHTSTSKTDTYIIAQNLRLSVTAPLSFGADMINHTPEDQLTSKESTQIPNTCKYTTEPNTSELSERQAAKWRKRLGALATRQRVRSACQEISRRSEIRDVRIGILVLLKYKGADEETV